jgi:hypothetical protein
MIGVSLAPSRTEQRRNSKGTQPMYAHYFASKTTKLLIVTDQVRPVGGITYKVAGKAEARKRAKQHNAQPYNF